MKHSYRSPPAAWHCFPLQDFVFPIKSAIPEQTESQEERVKYSYCSLKLKTCLSPVGLKQSHYYLLCFEPTRSKMHFPPLWEMAMLLFGKLLAALLLGMVFYKQIHPNHTNGSWLREGFVDVERHQWHWAGISFPHGSSRAKIRFDPLLWSNARLRIDPGIKHQIPHLLINSFLLAYPINTEWPRCRLCPILANTLHAFPSISHPHPATPLYTYLAPSSHTRVICRFGRQFCRRNMISFNISLVMFSDSSYSICL